MDQRKHPLSYHLIELRQRLLRVGGVFCVSAATGWYFAPQFFYILLLPFAHTVHPNQLIYTHITEAFTTYMRIGINIGALITTPYALNSLWGFMAPGLRIHEARTLKPLFWLTPLLFTIGMCSAYFIVLPQAFSFFAGFQETLQISQSPIRLELIARMESYLDITLQIMFAFGLAFQIPVVMYVVVILGIITPQHFRIYRRLAALIILILSAALTPPDVMSMVVLAIPVYALYEGTIIIIARQIKRKQKHA
ncbi:MAG: twin-arginine translocase subunit TatC [Alphaproteobacteria bacterium]|nr:MAG: twin-arginine translocase subunit TatC [Alphaproteobacteria bacterium]